MHFGTFDILKLMNILDKKYLIISVVGSHAGEGISPIFLRKKNEIDKNGKTYWLIKSFKARTTQIQKLCQKAESEGEAIYCAFITASAKNGAKPTVSDSLVKHISENNDKWIALPEDVKITGKIDSHSTALVLSELEILGEPLTIDLWNYSDADNKPIKLQLGASTVCCINVPSVGMKSRNRIIAAWGKLKSPYAVWVK